MQSLSLHNLADDIVYLIAAQLDTASYIKPLSRTSHRTRSICMPLLFAHCRISLTNRDEPPTTIRPYVRRLTFYNPFDSLEGFEDLGRELLLLPFIHTIRFLLPPYNTPWTFIKTCMDFPQITKLSFRESKTEPWADFDKISLEDVRNTRNSLHVLEYHTTMWREFEHEDEGPPRLAEVYAAEARFLGALVERMPMSARRLSLPFETSPWSQMVQVTWPHLRSFHIHGRYLSSDQTAFLPGFLAHESLLAALSSLSINLAQPPACARAPILGTKRYSSTSEPLYLRSLTVSYPDPEDILFEMRAPALTHLALRDWPRYYFHVHCSRNGNTSRWVAPILSSSECLYVLKKMCATSLESLELVYKADDSEDELLRHVTSAYPRLSQLQLHRYRRQHDDAVPFIQIARQLATIKYLQDVRLNLDFRETIGQLDSDPYTIRDWDRLHERVGREMLAIFHASCPMLCVLRMLYHHTHGSTWTGFVPLGDEDAVLIFDYDSPEKDSEPLPYFAYRPRFSDSELDLVEFQTPQPDVS